MIEFIVSMLTQKYQIGKLIFVSLPLIYNASIIALISSGVFLANSSPSLAARMDIKYCFLILLAEALASAFSSARRVSITCLMMSNFS